MRIMVYSHDAYGLGNVRRMLAICEYLLDAIPDLSILLLSGSPMLQSFRLPQRLDYIKLPCLNRDESGQLSTKYLSTDLEMLLTLRADIMLAAARNFQPDLLMVDKKPYGLRDELKTTVRYLKVTQPQTRFVLLLRDILDTPATTIREWQTHGYYAAIADYYDQILVVGMPEIFDPRHEYALPPDIAAKIIFCGYVQKAPGHRQPHAIRQELGVAAAERLVLVTTGGGADGYPLVAAYLDGLTSRLSANPPFKTLVITGSEMPVDQQQKIQEKARSLPQVQVLEFTNDPMSYIAAADLVVCMSGYNTITEVLSQAKRAIVVPRTKPGQEQLIRAERMQKFNLLVAIEPELLTPELLRSTVERELQTLGTSRAALCLDLGALPQVAQTISDLLPHTYSAIAALPPAEGNATYPLQYVPQYVPQSRDRNFLARLDTNSSPPAFLSQRTMSHRIE
ncbi:glycosyltransferase family protein [Myxacorys almedinensis]|uniref:Glycosyltransferase n=1 Tax=Myxacorys almedinensis A TaxID=2690445 RepID=A0A8J8CH87_9CYAN|nr:glycosyltransferase [Myxacorys almedinensis]NDJ16443.1 glycosyltransferase [Myxacorys almedinensis A]